MPQGYLRGLRSQCANAKMPFEFPILDEETPMRRVSQRPQARGRRVGRPVQFGGTPDGQDQRHSRQAGEGRVDMTLQDVAGVDRHVIKEADIRRAIHVGKDQVSWRGLG